MAFDFLGTFTRTQLDALDAFVRAHAVNADARIRAIKGEIERLGWLEYDFDETGQRVSYRVQPEGSVLYRHALAFEYAGGDLNALQIRSRGDWIYQIKGEWDLREGVAYTGGLPSEGEYRASGGLYDDQEPGTEVARMKQLVIPSLKRRLEDAEFRVKRTVDRSDQLIEELILIIKRTTGAETLDALRTNLDFMIASGDYPSASE